MKIITVRMSSLYVEIIYMILFFKIIYLFLQILINLIRKFNKGKNVDLDVQEYIFRQRIYFR